MYIVPYKQSNPNRCLTVDGVMSLLGPSHSRLFCLKHKVMYGQHGHRTT